MIKRRKNQPRNATNRLRDVLVVLTSSYTMAKPLKNVKRFVMLIKLAKVSKCLSKMRIRSKLVNTLKVTANHNLELMSQDVTGKLKL